MFIEFENTAKKKTPARLFSQIVSQIQKGRKQYPREPLSRNRLRYSFFINNLSQPEKGVNVYWVDVVSQPL